MIIRTIGIASAYIIVYCIEANTLIKEKTNRNLLFYTILMILSLFYSEFVLNSKDLPSIAAMIKVVLSPIIGK